MTFSSCELCGGNDHRKFPAFITGQLQVVICRHCGHMFTNPRWTLEEISKVYEEQFEDDPGAPALLAHEGGALREQKFAKARDYARANIMPDVERFVLPQGKRWLDVRFRSGGLLAELQERGAEISGVDLFDANKTWLSDRLSCDRLYTSNVYDLLSPVRGSFDVVSILSIHALAHVPVPSQLLRGVGNLLEPGGLLIMDEKDVTRVSPGARRFPFEPPYGMAHFHHLTLQTTVQFVLNAGFEVVHADFSGRSSAQLHFLVVARKQAAGETVKQAPMCGEDPSRIYRHMILQYVRIVVRRKVRGAARRMGLGTGSKSRARQ